MHGQKSESNQYIIEYYYKQSVQHYKFMLYLEFFF